MTREKAIERTKARKAKGKARQTIERSAYEEFWIAESELHQAINIAKMNHPSNWKG